MTIVRKIDQQTVMPFLKRTDSTRQQQRTEMECQPFFVNLATLPPSQLDHLRQSGLLMSTEGSVDEQDLDICLLVDRHIQYLSPVFQPTLRSQLRPSFVTLDSSRSWMIYWTLHACDLLDYKTTAEERQAMVQTLQLFFHPRDGGFGGGPGQLPHAATTYAAVMSLAILASHERHAMDSVKNDTLQPSSSHSALHLLQQVRKPLYQWMLTLADEQGRVRMHHDGEIDVRATYCCIAVLSLLQLPLPLSWANFVSACQTWEGGFGGEPGAEAHGGYTYCAIAALQLMESTHLIDLGALCDYASRRQLALEGGFSGRSNKLVDGCYSFWQGGALAVVSDLLLSNDGSNDTKTSAALFDTAMLERYILLCAQDIHGGLRDKPSKTRDFYHSCYNLSGLSIAQQYRGKSSETEDEIVVFSRHASVAATHPCYNIRNEHVQYFKSIHWQE
ncbi:protein farnesyltransferase subunit beta [Fistulifera solaris]|uniref:Protein farnesyltransferase subunit beta n=1 Tax=Fistulifera solaris TaxID=1519565 RepID=A0A1Z5JCI5_FISSO|nr:protein farnesyltransferase subunit beta [Fistulifera solaris]|eukprot:GAX11602.1 protein farnesyltransferase subunit beta [Fistulifera solaris]